MLRVGGRRSGRGTAVTQRRIDGLVRLFDQSVAFGLCALNTGGGVGRPPPPPNKMAACCLHNTAGFRQGCMDRNFILKSKQQEVANVWFVSLLYQRHNAMWAGPETGGRALIFMDSSFLFLLPVCSHVARQHQRKHKSGN